MAVPGLCLPILWVLGDSPLSVLAVLLFSFNSVSLSGSEYPGVSLVVAVGSRDLVLLPRRRCVGLVFRPSIAVFLRLRRPMKGSCPDALDLFISVLATFTAASAAPLACLFPGLMVS